LRSPARTIGLLREDAARREEDIKSKSLDEAWGWQYSEQKIKEEAELEGNISRKLICEDVEKEVGERVARWREGTLLLTRIRDPEKPDE